MKTRFFRNAVRVLVPPTLALFVGCAPQTLFVSDPFAAALVAYQEDEKLRIERLLSRAPQPSSYKSLTQEDAPVAAVEAEFDSATPSLVFLTPYVDDVAHALAPIYETTQFVILDAVGVSGRGGTTDASETSEGVLELRFDRRSAMRRSGTLTAVYLEGGQGAESSSRALLLGADTSTVRSEELDAFVAGFESAVDSSGAILEERRFDTVPSPDVVRSIFRELGDEYGVVIVFLQERSPYALEQVLNSGLVYGGENLGLFDSLQERMLFSVESRLSDALQGYFAEQSVGGDNGDDDVTDDREGDDHDTDDGDELDGDDGATTKHRASGVLVTQARLVLGESAPGDSEIDANGTGRLPRLEKQRTGAGSGWTNTTPAGRDEGEGPAGVGE